MTRDLKGAVGVLGGTFDPVHVGHLSIAQQVLRKLGLARALLLPAGRPPHKDPDLLAPAADRLAMVEAACRGMMGLEACAYEVERGGVSYTIDTLRWLAGALDGTLVFIIGADTLDELAAWRAAADLVREFEFAVVTRPGYQIEVPAPLQQLVGGDLAEKLSASVVEIEPAPVSSTAVRERLGSGEPVSGMVRAPVERYIRAHRLYGTGEGPLE